MTVPQADVGGTVFVAEGGGGLAAVSTAGGAVERRNEAQATVDTGVSVGTGRRGPAVGSAGVRPAGYRHVRAG